MIRFTKSSITELEEQYVLDVLRNGILSGDGKYTPLVYKQFEQRFGIKNMLLTTSGTAALEMASILIDLCEGDEIIVPSFTFSSTVNAFLLRGAKPVFCDIRRDTLNIDETLIEGLITDKTKAIYTVDYSGVACEYDVINKIADKYGIFVIEDSAQAVGSYYKGQPCGTLTPFGCYSFHETKNYVMGEGGGIVLNEDRFFERAEIIREKGTNRSQLIRGMVDKYTWHDIGSSFLPSDILAAVLYAQMERFDEIMSKRLNVWNTYQRILESAETAGKLKRQVVPPECEHNGHLYNIILPNSDVRNRVIDEMKARGAACHICYVPLHSAPMGRKLGYEPSSCPVTEEYGSCILRLPLHANMTTEDAEFVADSICEVV
ncbi:MAG: dTDP-4-amino-4,6-dideoxygalactose transaminase [Oscillospiraceae bacterium]|jgi:dTDP-4-amino-4,6-dideoxygalactose transaminase|nr:dTDP-4-amino-4,6-dideoxygalactose transaminase [Oscillospiraceae bacterium]